MSMVFMLLVIGGIVMLAALAAFIYVLWTQREKE